MKRLPFGLRVAAGITVTAAEQARTLPTKLVGLPITVLSETLQLSMRVQQQLTELAIRGDSALSALRPVEQAPSWATFDEDLLDAEPDDDQGGEQPEVAELRADLLRLDRGGATELSAWEGADGIPAARTPGLRNGTGPADEDGSEPGEDGDDATDIVDDPWEQEQRALAADHEPGEFDTTPGAPAPPEAFRNYPELSIPQLRARLRRFSLADLEELLAYERATGDRAEYVQMLTNRIDTVRGDA